MQTMLLTPNMVPCYTGISEDQLRTIDYLRTEHYTHVTVHGQNKFSMALICTFYTEHPEVGSFPGLLGAIACNGMTMFPSSQ